MRVQQRIPSPPFHPHAHQSVPPSQNHAQSHLNGTHSGSSRPRYSASTTEHLNGDDMNPYPNPYGLGNGPPHQPYQHQHQQQQHQHQQQRQYAPQNQLPPMHSSMGMPPSMSMPPPVPPPAQGVAGPSTTQHPPIYPAISAAGLPQPGARALEVQTNEGPQSLSGSNGKYKFELRVEQQPARARMCGFGDKDRRPITPPPCVRLLIFDAKTGEEIPHDDIDGSFFVLQVDLWDDSATREVNIVRSSSSSPAVSISTATTTSYPPTDRGTQYYAEVTPGVYHTPNGIQVFGQPSGYGQPQLAYARSMIDPRAGLPSYTNSTWNPPVYHGPPGGVQPQSMNLVPMVPITGPTQQNMFTRNLIGSLTVNAASLKDTEGNMGYWFVLQDLSVRTEGYFRLRMNFIDVGNAASGGLNKTRAPVLAYVYSDKFQVYSAKKFPGVIESTSLSKVFAQQGIKIPIRKDTKSEKDEDEED